MSQTCTANWPNADNVEHQAIKIYLKKTIKVQSSDVLVVLMGFASTVSFFFFFLFKLSDGQIMVARASDVKTSF